jgi:pimeloyl-ACP methyl ester carboxylesterase
MAEIVDIRQFDRPHHSELATFASGHIATTGGVISFLREGPDGVEDRYYFVGGLVSGCAYDVPACVAAQSGDASATLVRHGNNRFTRDVLERDAIEIAETIEIMNGDARAHIVGHSKGTKVSLLAAEKVDPGIDVASVTLVNPVIGMGITRKNIIGKLRELPGTALRVGMRMLQPDELPIPTRAAAWGEMLKRLPAINAETIALLTTQSIHKPDIEKVKERPGTHNTIVVMAYGSDDEVTKAKDIEEGIDLEDMEFDAVLKFDQPGQNRHLSIINNPSLMQAVIGVEALIVQAMRHEAPVAQEANYDKPAA